MDTLHIVSTIIFFTCFAFVAWQKFFWGLGIFFFLLPTYLIRFKIFGIPTTFLEIMFLILLTVFIIERVRQHKIKSIYRLPFTIYQKNKFLFFSISLFLLAAKISIFISSDLKPALGEWKAFYVEPILLFLILVSIDKFLPLKGGDHASRSERAEGVCDKTWEVIIFALILSGLITALFAIFQKFTGWMVPYDFWENNNTYRVTAWYGFPNGIGLYLAPIYPLAIYSLNKTYKKIRQSTVNQFTVYCLLFTEILFLVTSPLAILFAKSTGALVGLAAGIGLLLILNKKTRWPSIIIGLVTVSSLFGLSSLAGIREEILLQDRSGQIRIAMWQEAVELLQDNPVFGTGLASYSEKIIPYHKTVAGEGIEIFHHPHNIFLTMYVNLGLLGLVGFLGIIVWFFKTGFSAIKNKIQNHSLFTVHCLLASMATILVHGLVDSPYIKNDLAMLFWLVVSLMFIQVYGQRDKGRI